MKHRTPAGCDRIFYRFDPNAIPRASPTSSASAMMSGTDMTGKTKDREKSAASGEIRQLEYRSCPDIRMSDHQPVSALFEVQYSLFIRFYLRSQFKINFLIAWNDS